MALFVKSLATPTRMERNWFPNLLDELEIRGYKPLIRGGKRNLIGIFEGILEDVDPIEEIDVSYGSLSRMMYRRLPRRANGNTRQVSLFGDLFFNSVKNGFLYITIFMTISGYVVKRPKETQSPFQIEIGLLGGGEPVELTEFSQSISAILDPIGIQCEWVTVEPTSTQFQDLLSNTEIKFRLASSLADSELLDSKVFDDTLMRSLATVIRKSGGGLLTTDLLKKGNASGEKITERIDLLEDRNLVKREYVIICKKTSQQVMRFDVKAKLEQMDALGILCSCGVPISQERVEELVVPMGALQLMMDQSFWMTAGLVKTLVDLGVGSDKILLNLQEGAEEIDAFADVDGSLLMFELKDNEFSMGHVYPFNGRIGLYKPKYAFIVSTKGIASDVKEYLRRVKPDSEIVYVESLGDLTNKIELVIGKVRSIRAAQLLEELQQFAQVRIPLIELSVRKIGLDKSAIPPPEPDI